MIFERDKTSENIKYQPLNKDDISNHTHKQKNRTNRSANDAKTNDKDQKRNNFLLPNNSLVVSACFNTQITTETQYVVAHNYPAHPRRLNGIVPWHRRTVRLLQKSIWKQLADTPSSTAAYSNASKNCSDFLLSLFSLSKKKTLPLTFFTTVISNATLLWRPMHNYLNGYIINYSTLTCAC